MSDFKLDGSRPMMASISLKALRDIISLLEYELTDGEVESDAEFSKVKELLDECRDSAADAGQVEPVVWHFVNYVPYDPEKHADLFDEGDEKPELVWEGDLPPEDDIYLVTCQQRNGSRFVEFSNYDGDYCEFDRAGVIAWAYPPEPYKTGLEEQNQESVDSGNKNYADHDS